MNSLADILLASQRQPAVVEDSVLLIEQHVGARGGLKGLALRTGLTMLKSARPNILPRAVDRLLPEFVRALEPLYREYRRQAIGGGFGAFLQQNGERAAEALLAAADRRVEASSSHTVKSNYRRMRGTAESELLLAMPAMAAMIQRHLA